MFKRIRNDIKAVFERDPAAKNIIEIMMCYPGLHALWMHRIAHWLYKRREFTAARLISQITKFFTSIEIHPGAEIKEGLFIDHGSGVVIGETAQIGRNCLIYQGVVLGGTSLEKKKRHPTLMDNVVVGAGAIVLGPVVINSNARIGAGAVVISDVPAGATAVGVPAKIGLGFTGRDIQALEHGKLPDPVADAVRYVINEQDKLEERLEKIETMEGVKAHIDKVMEEKKKEILKEFAPCLQKFIEGSGI
ncbi:MAG: serine O-acetyltransferase [Elusimicrobia bacterium]|nr:serine O-acetyltransferase [Elusimicrobiota bacterium]